VRSKCGFATQIFELGKVKGEVKMPFDNSESYREFSDTQEYRNLNPYAQLGHFYGKYFQRMGTLESISIEAQNREISEALEILSGKKSSTWSEDYLNQRIENAERKIIDIRKTKAKETVEFVGEQTWRLNKFKLDKDFTELENMRLTKMKEIALSDIVKCEEEQKNYVPRPHIKKETFVVSKVAGTNCTQGFSHRPGGSVF